MKAKTCYNIMAQVPSRQFSEVKPTAGVLDLTLDCAGVGKRGRASKPGKGKVDLWQKLQEGDPSACAGIGSPPTKARRSFCVVAGRENFGGVRQTSFLEVPDAVADRFATKDAIHRRIMQHLAESSPSRAGHAAGQRGGPAPFTKL